jgi:hypothetical protein
MKETLHSQWDMETTIYYIKFFHLYFIDQTFSSFFMEFLCLTHRPQVMDTHTTIVQVQLQHMFVN